jgi:hypothetical protein
MTMESSAEGPTRDNSPWPAIIKAALIASLVALFLLLGITMAHHRFFRGGRIDEHGVLRP